MSSRPGPIAYATQYVTILRLTPKLALAIEVHDMIFTIYVLICSDCLDPFMSSAIEHLARRILQVTQACRAAGLSPNLE